MTNIQESQLNSDSKLIGEIVKRDRLLAEILAVCESAKTLNEPTNILAWYDRTGKAKIEALWESDLHD